MKLERDDLMHIARAIKQHKQANVRLATSLLERNFPGAKQWATLLGANNVNLDNLFRVILNLNGTIAPPDGTAQMKDDGTDLTQAGVVLAHIAPRR